jgi:CheY-like chemotaxis protein
MVTDIGMPGLDGFELLQRVRRTAHGKELPVVALTAFAMEDHMQAVERAGFDAHVSKRACWRRARIQPP